MLMLAAMALVVPACGPYQLKGKVVEGVTPGVFDVSDGDDRLKLVGVSGATVQVILDPRSPNRKLLGNVGTNGAGEFRVNVDEVGAGALIYEIGVVARAKGHQYAESQLNLPGLGRRLLIVLPRGMDTYRAPEDPLRDSLQFLPPKQ
jgi:hypothetical protein